MIYEKRTLRIIFPYFTYREAFSAAKCPRLDDNRLRLCSKVFPKIQSSSNCKINALIPQTRFSDSVHGQKLRIFYNFSLLKCNTDRLKCSFFIIIFINGRQFNMSFKLTFLALL